MARVVVLLNFSAFLDKPKLKDDGSNYTDWVRNLRIILIAAQKNYVLESTVGCQACYWSNTRCYERLAEQS